MKNKLFSHLPRILGMALMMPSANASAQGTVEDYNRAYTVSRHFQADHTMGEDYGEHKRYDFFVKNLLGVDPPKWNLINSK